MSTQAPPARTTTGLDRRWSTLQRTVALGMIFVLLVPMVFIARGFIAPLAVALVLFAVPLALSPFRPRASAIAIGAVSALWLVMQLANLPRVLPDLLRPHETLTFAVTAAMLVLPLAGVVGLVATLRR